MRTRPVEAVSALFAGSGELRTRCRALDWSATPVGSSESWPHALRTAIRICLDATAIPMAIWAGPDFTLIYNDAYAAVLGPQKHPWALGRPARDVWPESWDRYAPQLRRVMESGESVQHLDEPVASAFAPIRDEHGSIIAALNIFHETTGRAQSAAQREDVLSAEERWRDSEARLKFAQEAAGAGMWHWDIVTGEVEWSDQLYRLFGLDPRTDAPASRASWRAALHPEDAAYAETQLQESIANHSPLVSEHRIVLPSGEIRWLTALGRTTYDAEGRPRQMSGICLDTTERKRAEEALRRSEALARDRLVELEALYETAPIGLCVLDEQLRWVRVNKVIAEINGRPIEEHIGRTPMEVVPDVGPQAEEALRTILRTGERLDFEMTGTTEAQPGVERCWSEHWVPIKDPLGRITGISVAAEEITDRKRAARALAESEERFRTLADNIAQFAWMADETGSIFWFNKRWYDYTGTTLEEMAGWGWQAVHHPDHVNRVVEKIRRCFATGEAWEDTFPLRGKDGTYRWFLSRAIPIRDESGQVVRWFGTNTDVTEQRAAEEALREADRQKNEFLAMLSHDLRNPFAVIRTSLGLLEQAGADSPHGKRALAILGRQVNQMGRLLDDLLDVTRIAKGKLFLKCEPLELNAIVRVMGEDHAEVFERERIDFRVIVPASPLYARVDGARLTQAIGNLLQNAAKFTPGGGRVTLSLRATDSAEALIEVSDNGAGIQPELLGRLFDPLVQADRTLHQSRGGLGLGLALVKGIVELHGGSVSAASDGPGCGAVFTIQLPLEIEAPVG